MKTHNKVYITIVCTLFLVIGVTMFLVVRVFPTNAIIPNKEKVIVLPADSEMPASGICAEVPQKTNEVVLVVHEEGAFPRCQKINSDQLVIIRNDTDKDFRFSLGENKSFSSVVSAHGEYRFPVFAGELLAPGVHEVSMVSAPYIRIELWLVENKVIFPSTKIAPTEENQGMCAQVITHAKNISTGEEKDFPTPCDVPDGWEKAL